MGVGLRVLTGQVTNPSTTITQVTANTGDTFTVPALAQGSNGILLDAWAFTTTNLLARIRSPRMHDQAQNMRLQPIASKSYPLTPRYGSQTIYSQDPIIVELTGGASEVDAITLLEYYPAIQGIAARLHSWSEIKPLIANLFTVEVDLTSSGTSCNYSATVAINGSFDTFIRNVDYAIIGYECPTEGLTVGITGPDTGNTRLGGPLTAAPWITRGWFVDQSNDYGLPMIPVINSANVAATNVDVVAQATTTSYKVAFHLAELSSQLPGAAA
jgi:hypothetical protein